PFSRSVVHHLRKTIYIALILGILFSCKQKTEPKKAENKPTEIPAWKIDLDTILERNNPKNLDLSKHQLFIDTTKTSEFYQKYSNWKPHKLDNDVVSYHINEIAKKHKSKKIEYGNFPKQWVSLKKINNEFVIYEPCDGTTTSFELTENSVIFYYQIEPDADLISELKKLTDNTVELELRTVPQKIESEKTKLSITPTEFKNIYLLKYSFGEWFVTPRDKVVEFDLIVNHCPTTKRMEFKGFDK
ncbi:hypothetical protein, partial [Urechidicola vernalis]